MYWKFEEIGMDDKSQTFGYEELKHTNIICFKLLGRSTKVELNRIVFGCALKYILLEQKGSKGKGDKNEAIIARYRKDNPAGVKRIGEYIKHFGDDLIIQENKEFCQVRRKSSLIKPLFCFFSITDDLSHDASNITDCETHEITKEYILDYKLFDNFKGVGNLNIDNFIMVNYNNKDVIGKKVTDAFKTIGVKRKNIKIDDIKYSRLEGTEWECPEYREIGLDVDFPYELFYKDKEFSYQSESRIVVNDKNWSFNTKCCYDEKSKSFCDNNEKLNKSIFISPNDSFEVIKNMKISEKGILVQINLPIRKMYPN